MKLTLKTTVRVICPISIATALAASTFLVPTTADAQNAEAIRNCINSLMYTPRTYPQQATGISAEAAAIACQNQNSVNSGNIDALRNCINSLMYMPRTYPRTATGISDRAAATACRDQISTPGNQISTPGNQTSSPRNVDALRSCIESLMYEPRTYPRKATGITPEAAATACQTRQ